MIFVITGYHYLPFDRLILVMDEIAGRCDEKVIIQKGPSQVTTLHAESFSWETEDELTTHFQLARLIVSHAGVGTILDARRHGKPIIVFPRKKAYGEHIDDHQMEIAEALARKKSIRVAHDMATLEKSIATPADSISATDSDKGRLIDALKNIVSQL